VENRDALGAAVLNGLHDAITEANATSEIRAVVVTNEGTTFSAGVLQTAGQVALGLT